MSSTRSARAPPAPPAAAPAPPAAGDRGGAARRLDLLLRARAPPARAPPAPPAAAPAAPPAAAPAAPPAPPAPPAAAPAAPQAFKFATSILGAEASESEIKSLVSFIENRSSDINHVMHKPMAAEIKLIVLKYMDNTAFDRFKKIQKLVEHQQKVVDHNNNELSKKRKLSDTVE